MSMNVDLEKLNVVVTAGGSGIGLAIARKFLVAGARVSICDVSPDTLSTALAANSKLHGEVADVGSADSVKDYFAGVLELFGGVDVLVNNAGIGGPRGKIEDIDTADWQQTININLSGMFYCTQQVVPAMKSKGSGCIINISTANARTGLPLRTPYVASKAGVLGLTRNLARELGPDNIRCNAILPGPVSGERGRKLVAMQAKERQQSFDDAEIEFLRYVSMKSWIDPGEIGDMAVFLASGAGRHVSGQFIGVCGNLEWEE